VFITSSLSSRPDIFVCPIACAANISARCEIDLSPGTVILPFKPLDLLFYPILIFRFPSHTAKNIFHVPNFPPIVICKRINFLSKFYFNASLSLKNYPNFPMVSWFLEQLKNQPQ
jgi:hypothetical protein